MIDVEARTRAVIIASTTVTALVPSARVYALEQLPVDAVFPAISVQEIDSVGGYSQDGPALIRSRVQIDAWAKAKPSAKAIAVAVRDALQAYVGDADGIQDFEDAGRRSLYEADTKLYRISADFYAWSRDQAA